MNRVERKLAVAENNLALYSALQNENLNSLIPELKSEITKMEEDLKMMENELKITNNKPLALPEYQPINRSNLLTGCSNDDTAVKKYEKKSPKKKRGAPKKTDEEEGVNGEKLVDEVALKKWSTMISGKEEKFQRFAAKAMWAHDILPLFAEDLSNPAKAMEVVGTLAAFIEAFGEKCDESKLAEVKINEVISSL